MAQVTASRGWPAGVSVVAEPATGMPTGELDQLIKVEVVGIEPAVEGLVDGAPLDQQSTARGVEDQPLDGKALVAPIPLGP